MLPPPTQHHSFFRNLTPVTEQSASRLVSVIATFTTVLFLPVVESADGVKMEVKPDERSFTAVPSNLQLNSCASSPAADRRCSTPTLSLYVGPVAVNPAVRELALELLKV